MNAKQQITQRTSEFVKQELSLSEAGHDWWHAIRVLNNAKLIAKTEKCNLFIIELASLLHDIADSKFNKGDEIVGPLKAFNFLIDAGVNIETVNNVNEIIKNISFKGGNTIRSFNSIELDIVMDADRLDAIGAIGIARAFSYGGFRGREFFNPNISPNYNMNAEEYKKNKTPTINHFYEKLLLLKDRMNTSKGKALAEERHQFLMTYINQFYKEWNGDEGLENDYYPW